MFVVVTSQCSHTDMLTTILLACLPLSLPSLYLAYLLVKKRFLWSVFNQQAALILTLSGRNLGEGSVDFIWKKSQTLKKKGTKKLPIRLMDLTCPDILNIMNLPLT